VREAGDNGAVRGANPELAAALGRVILARRHELDKSQEALAYESGMSVRQYQKIETGEAVNSFVGNIYAIALALDLKFAELAERTERAMRKRRSQ
jgi:transcriptional regulator with XRE-family HTH domain